MLRAEHNEKYGVDRQPEEQVCCHLFGYGEISQYDPDCVCCYLGHRHTWEKHDLYIERSRLKQSQPKKLF